MALFVIVPFYLLRLI